MIDHYRALQRAYDGESDEPTRSELQRENERLRTELDTVKEELAILVGQLGDMEDRAIEEGRWNTE